MGITMPIVKHSFLLQSTDDLTETFREAFYIASTGRPGPVPIDIPSDLQGAEMVFHYPDGVNIPSYRPTYKGNAKQSQATRLIEILEAPGAAPCRRRHRELPCVPGIGGACGSYADPRGYHAARQRLFPQLASAELGSWHVHVFQIRQHGHDGMRPHHCCWCPLQRS